MSVRAGEMHFYLKEVARSLGVEFPYTQETQNSLLSFVAKSTLKSSEQMNKSVYTPRVLRTTTSGQKNDQKKHEGGRIKM